MPSFLMLGASCLAVLAQNGAATSAQRRLPAADPKATPFPESAIVAAPGVVKPRPEYKPPVGETLVYSALWRVFNAGVASLRMEKAGSETRVLGVGDATGSAALLYHVRDRYESNLDPSTFCSHNTTRHIEEGFRRVETTIIFDYSRQKAVLEQKNLKNSSSKREEHYIPGCVTDMLSAIYYVATLPLELGKTYTFPLSDGGEPVAVNVHVEAREQIKTAAGTFNTIRVQPEAASGLLKDRGKIWVWYSDDAARIPVQARAHLYWGTLTFILQRMDRN